MQINLALECKATPLAQNCSFRVGVECNDIDAAALRQDRFTDEKQLAKAGAQMSTSFWTV